jgi:hypothetical protein
MMYFEAEMKKTQGIYCHSCMRKAGKGTKIRYAGTARSWIIVIKPIRR